jgi:hypothetical protein
MASKKREKVVEVTKKLTGDETQLRLADSAIAGL